MENFPDNKSNLSLEGTHIYNFLQFKIQKSLCVSKSGSEVLEFQVLKAVECSFLMEFHFQLTWFSQIWT